MPRTCFHRRSTHQSGFVGTQSSAHLDGNERNAGKVIGDMDRGLKHLCLGPHVNESRADLEGEQLRWRRVVYAPWSFYSVE